MMRNIYNMQDNLQTPKKINSTINLEEFYNKTIMQLYSDFVHTV